MKVLIIDSHNMLHRDRYGFGSGPHKIFFNFFKMLMGEVKKLKPDIVYVVDEGKPVQSLAILESYKGNRVKIDDPDFRREKSEVFDCIKNLTGFVYVKHPFFECDDVVGHLATVVHPADDVTIVSTDSDFIQLVTKNVQLWHPIKKEFIESWPVDYVTWKALKGDPTDNVPGIDGIGPKRAMDLAGDLEKLQKFLDGDSEKRIRFEEAQKLVKLKPVDNEGLEVVQSNFSDKNLLEEFSKREIRSIVSGWRKMSEAFAQAGGKSAI